MAGCSLPSLADFTQVDAFWTDNFALEMPITDNSGAALDGGDVIQIGFFKGVDPNKNPNTYTDDDWDSFFALTG
ncbi:MAG: hypothetical protein GWO24_24135, partial [Akkermansiaceae bacterium]|nr:hypothetical protein [Akkermansiaceae bacterium]